MCPKSTYNSVYQSAKFFMSEIKSYNPQRFHHFLAHMTRLMDQGPNETQALAGASQLLGDLISSDDWLLPDFAQPHPNHYQQYLLFADPQDRFSVVSFVWGPGQATPIHDHTVWGLIGMLRGSEMCQSYSRMSDGRWAAAGLQIQMIPGDVEAVSPRLGDVHRVWNAYSDQVSISIHVYGANIGKVPRSIYYEDGSRKTFISGYSNVPEMFSGLVDESNMPPGLQPQAPIQLRPVAQSAANIAAPKLGPSETQTTASVGGTPLASSPLAAASKVISSPPGAEQTRVFQNLEVSRAQVTKSNLNQPNLSQTNLNPTNLTQPSVNQVSKQQTVIREEASPVSSTASISVSKSEVLPRTSKGSQFELPLSAPESRVEQELSPELMSSSTKPPGQSELQAEGKALPPNALHPESMANSSASASASASAITASPAHLVGQLRPNPLDEKNVSTPLAVAQSTGEVVTPNSTQTADTGALTEVPVLSPEPAQPNITIEGFEVVTPAQVRNFLLLKTEIALIDVREEDPFAQSHPLFACNMPIGRIEVDAYRRIPRKDTLIVVYDNSEGLALKGALTLKRMGYTRICLLGGGLSGWAAAGGELFKDVNVPSKAFGEWVETFKRTPSLPASEVKALLDQKADVVVLDARRFDEYQTMSIPGAISVPGAELALRVRTIAPKATTRIIVNCAGRTRSIIGAQSLVNAGIPNPVCALRNGTIGWMLAGQELTKGAQARFPETDPADLAKAQASALALAFRSGIKRIDLSEFLELKKQTDRTTYLFDVRTPEEYSVSHMQGALSAPGGQLVQETDHNAPVRGARIVLYDTDGVRAFMTGSWLVQLGWEVYVIKNVTLNELSLSTELNDKFELPPTLGPIEEATASEVKEWITNRTNLTLVIDVGDSAQYVKRHIPGAWWILRSQMHQDFSRVHKANRYVLTCPDGLASRYVVEELKQLVRPGVQVMWLKGGNASWIEQGFSTQQGESYVVSPRIDRYRRPYEGTQNPVQAMQAYLDWEYGLVDQLKRDGTHGFKLI